MLVKRVVAECMLVASLSAFSVQIEYTGEKGGDWFEEKNWSPARVPSTADDVVVSGREFSVTKPVAVKSLTVKKGAAAVFKAPKTEGVCAIKPEESAALLYTGAMRVSVSEALVVEPGARLVAVNDPLTGTPVFFDVGEFTLCEGGEFTASGGGWKRFPRKIDWQGRAPVGAVSGVNQYSLFDTNYFTYAFAAGTSYTIGAGHGSASRSTLSSRAFMISDADGKEELVSYFFGGEYGNSLAPFLPGSPPGVYNPKVPLFAGGGTAAMFASGKMEISGVVSADAERFADELAGAASGGSIWLGAASLRCGPEARLYARGGNSGYNSTGGGGRIAVVIGADAAALDVFAADKQPSGFSVSDLTSVPAVAGALERKQQKNGTAKLIVSESVKNPVLVAVKVTCVGDGALTANGEAVAGGTSLVWARGGETVELKAKDGNVRFFGGIPGGIAEDAVKVEAVAGTTVTAVFPGAKGVVREYVGNPDGGRWDLEENWNPRGVPSIVDDVVVSNRSVVMSGVATAKSLSVFFGSVKASGLVVDGDVACRVGASVSASGGASGLPVRVGGDIDLHGSASFSTTLKGFAPAGKLNLHDAAVFSAPEDRRAVGASTNAFVSARPVFQDAGWTKTWWRPTTLRRRQIPAERKRAAKVVFLGDSITYHWEAAAIGGGVRERVFDPAPYNALFYGCSGDKTQHLLWRIVNGELDGVDPKAIVVMIGTNNNLLGEKPEFAIAGIESVVRELLSRFPKATIVLHPNLPVMEQPSAPGRKAGEQINAAVKPLADGKRVVWCDFNAEFLRPDGTISKDLMSDFVHPTQAGYEIWVKHLKPVLDKILAE